MSSVGSGYFPHMRAVDDLEREYEADKKSAQRREGEREAKLAKNSAHSADKAEKTAARTIDEIRDTFQRSAESRDARDRLQREEYKREIYGRAGRTLQNATSDAQAERTRATQEVASTREKYQQLSEDVEDHYDREIATHRVETEAKIAELQETHREELAKANAAKDESGADPYREKLQREAESAIREAHALVSEERRKSGQLAETFEAETESRERKNEHALEQRLHDQNRRVAQDLESVVRRERDSRAAETSQLREKIDEASQFQKNQTRERAEGRSEAIREFEDDWRSQLSNANSAYAAEKTKLQASSAESERNLTQTFNHALKEQGGKTAQVISRGNLDHAKQMAEAVTEYDRAKKQIELQASRTVELTQAAAAHQREKLVEQKDDALARQAKTYQETMSRQKLQEQAKVSNLERVLTNQSTTDDPGQISAAAENAVRRQMEEKYEKLFQVEATRNKDARERLHQGYARRMEDAQKDNSFTTTKVHQQSLMEQQSQRDQFLSHIQDVELMKTQQVAASNRQTEKTRDTLTQMSERSLGELRRHYEDLLGARELDHDTKMNTLRQEHEFATKNLRRDFSAQTGDLIRNYEKKFADQKSLADDQYRDLKTKTDAQIRDTDKRLAQALDQQERAHRQRTAESEAQNKERMRSVAQLHEEELDKMKRANALLLSKASASTKA